MRDLVSSFLETSLAELHRFGGTAPQFAGVTALHASLFI
jgi:hypothetical protein